jgi:hypothetical protein
VRPEGLGKFTITTEKGKLHNEKLRDLYYSPSIIRMNKLRRMRWAGHIARMERRETHVSCW